MKRRRAQVDQPVRGVPPSDRLVVLAEQTMALAAELQQLVHKLRSEAKS